MSITSLTLAFVQYGSVAAPAPAAAAAPAPAPAPALASNAGSCEHRNTCDSPRRSPLYRALMDALGSMANSAAPTTPRPGAEPTTPVVPTAAGTRAAPSTNRASAADAATEVTPAAATGTEATPAASAPVDLEEAVMNFARALMQALRGAGQADDGQGDEGRRAHGHHHHHHEHHDHGRRSWGDPAQRIEQLGARIGAPVSVDPADLPIAVPDEASAPAPVTTIAPVETASEVVAPATNAAVPTPAGTPTTMLYIQLSMNDAAPKASPFNRATQGLVQAFGSLQQALGLPATEGPDSLKAQLGAFLQALAEKLRGGEGNALASTQPGALLNVSA